MLAISSMMASVMQELPSICCLTLPFVEGLVLHVCLPAMLLGNTGKGFQSETRLLLSSWESKRCKILPALRENEVEAGAASFASTLICRCVCSSWIPFTRTRAKSRPAPLCARWMQIFLVNVASFFLFSSPFFLSHLSYFVLNLN